MSPVESPFALRSIATNSIRVRTVFSSPVVGGVKLNPLTLASPLNDERIQAAAEVAYIKARPLDNTDFVYQWRKQMARQFTIRALRELM